MRVEGGWTEDQPGNCCAVAGWGRGDAGGCCMPLEMQKTDRSIPAAAPIMNWMRLDMDSTSAMGRDPNVAGGFAVAHRAG